ncbi:hypothetical protein [Roseibacillus ishigakijimensis]|uniref:Uncharacterized protein n=1 Tax=Roseibacillus ishigakijimensis TaxID=454146 RepID=A0A934VNJ3_9BACT|nr:hypothetical protein [Roseibacillus ishigakijimensis]MBK1835100.1 hypothetical protein [Roseibacillus ishigakijimensis]
MLLPVFARAFLLLPLGLAPLLAARNPHLPLGVESLTGLRSSYLYRGFELAEVTLEGQLETEVTLSDQFSLGLAAWHLAESSDNFSESAFGLSLRRDWEEVSLSASLDYRAYSGSLFEDGLDAGLQAQWFFAEDWDLAWESHYDFGAEGSYHAFSLAWSHPFGDELFLSAHGGISAVSSYYERDGLNDLHTRLSLTYNLNSYLSITPFVGTSLGLQEGVADDVFAGVWLAVTF